MNVLHSLLQDCAMAIEETFEDFADVFEQMPSVGYLHGFGRTRPRTIRVSSGTVADDNFHAGVSFEPVG